MINDNAMPVIGPAIEIAVVRWLLGNHVADTSTPADEDIGATIVLST